MTMPRQRPHRSKQDYATPADFIQAAKLKLGITEFAFDFAADASNAKAVHWWGETQNSLNQPMWASMLKPMQWAWLNPPFSKIDPWAAKCWEMKREGGQIAFLVPASVGANWFKHFVHGKALVMFLNGRLAFIEGQPDELYPKDCILALYSPNLAPGYKVWTWRRELRRNQAA